MATLMGLPVELLCLILEEVGGRHLRRGPGVRRLCLSRKWYAAAHPVYLSGLGTTDIRIYGHNLDDIQYKFGPDGLRSLMYKNTTNLRLRFLGHFWDQNIVATYDSEDEDGNSVTSFDRNEAPFDFRQPKHATTMEAWRDEKLKPQLDALFEDLVNFSVLETVTLEASSDPDGQDGPHWDYLYQTTVYGLLRHLPVEHALSTLTLDICGMQHDLCDSFGHHLCVTLARLLPQIENVRLRMPTMCNFLLRLPDTRPLHTKLKTLVIKLHLPSFTNSLWPSTALCGGTMAPHNGRHLYRRLIKQSSSFLRQLACYRSEELAVAPQSHGMTGFRISFKDPIGPSIHTVDCLTQQYVSLPEGFFSQEDDGSPCWFELEPGRMSNGGPRFIL